ncbi:GNAT family N-acetyltransferase [Gilvimarinus sp. SDUM040013]|uniref:GNAT family N-acetyltransferase n=1 Tax=Gilvimarinus gilvus TaxID=3058038 RepID=A0ABU4S3P4_9GAMM|nr:GNAT family N-acetyltransferase [Gilvimarinus sp. SDUM040013]MDO3387494.1 GNAT family N-acetyltransferase [Gilvimarinus sp. SDUM040013]MDX6851569.1 GNAT family N-acetyltransferase [Gilvimarinus sp. SDUM040013]
MQIHQITTKEALPIRHRVLWPDKPVSFCEVEGDDDAIHYGAFTDGQLVCVASVYLEGSEARLRKFATLPEFQRRGIGSQVIEHAIAKLRHLNVRYFWCDARTSAQGFYQRFGLAVEGPKFEKSGVSYYKMSVQWG